jgi:hypothetical protein
MKNNQRRSERKLPEPFLECRRAEATHGESPRGASWRRHGRMGVGCCSERRPLIKGDKTYG